MTRRFALVLLVLPLVSACAIHPVPEDVTGVDTYHIVRQIRCETRETVKSELIRWLKRLASNPDPQASALTTQAEDLVVRYETDPDAVSSFHPAIFKGPENEYIRTVARLFYNTGIAYNFDLTMTEDNDLAADVSLVKPITRPKFTLGVGAFAKRKRTNNRTFLVTDTFGYLLTKLNLPVRGYRYCDGQLAAANYVYPIAGRIGVDKLVADFIRLTVFAALAEPGAKPGATGAPTMADKLTFTTALSGSINPVAVFTPLGTAFQFAGFSAASLGDRIDIHQVMVALAIPKDDVTDLTSLRSYLFSSERGGPAARGRLARGAPKDSPVMVGTSVTAITSTRAEQLAVKAIDQVKSREIQLLPPP